MKNEKGVTVVSLIIYVSSLLVIAIIIGRITTFFYNNVMDIQDDTNYSNAYSKINLALLSALQDENITSIEIGYYRDIDGIYAFSTEGENDSTAIRITTGVGEDAQAKTIGLIGDQLYYDKTLIGESINNFSLEESHENAEDKITYTIDVNVTVGNEKYDHTYTSIIE